MSGHLGLRSLKSSGANSFVAAHPSIASIEVDHNHRDDRVIVIGDREFAVAGIKSILTNNGFQVFCTRRSWRGIDVPVSDRATPFLIIFDIADGQTFDRNDVLALRHLFPNARIVLLHDQSREDGDFQWKIAGTNAILSRNVDQETLLKLLNVVLAGYGVISHHMLTRLRPPSRVQSNRLLAGKGLPAAVPLSERENEILGCIAEGYANKLIARRFTISEATVKIHVQNRTQAAIWSLQRGVSVGPLAS
jgi:two-component system, NarL family, nitrate/nitrite response regulator NarL